MDLSVSVFRMDVSVFRMDLSVSRTDDILCPDLLQQTGIMT
jgi:hypothetical protein